MKTRKILLCGVMAVLCFGLIGCSISLSGSAKMNAGGTGVIIEGAEPIVVQAGQPQRADAVKKFLIAAGVEEERLEATGYGEEKPIADNDTDEGKEKNRRVEFNITEGTATATPGQ